ncbi:MAG: UDP binding domain-containing protein, partial [Acidimicrobiales bacterium]
YKPFTAVTDEAFGWNLAAELAALGFAVTAYDPKVRVNLEGVGAADSADEAAAGAEVVVVATPWPDCGKLEILDADLVFDYWRIVPKSSLSPSAELIYPGVGTREDRG